MIELLKSSLAALIGAIVSITIILFQRKWAVEDKNDERDENILEELKKIDKKIDNVEEKLDAHILANEQSEMKQVRARILRFEADCLNSYLPYPTEAMFLQNADDEDAYRAFLNSEESNGFKNGYCENAMEYIDEVNQFCKKNNMFGKMKKEII